MRKKYTDVVIRQDSELRQIGPKIKYRLFKSRPYISGPSSILKLNTLIVIFLKKIPFLVRKGFHQKAYFWRNSRGFFKNCTSNKNDDGLKETSTFAIMSYHHPSKDFSDLYLSLLEQYRNLAFGRAVQFFSAIIIPFCSLHFFCRFYFIYGFSWYYAAPFLIYIYDEIFAYYKKPNFNFLYYICIKSDWQSLTCFQHWKKMNISFRILDIHKRTFLTARFSGIISFRFIQ